MIKWCGGKSMKVMQINSVCGIGSTGRIVTDIDKILKEHGYESYISYGRGASKNCDAPIRIGNRLDNYFHVIKTRIFDGHGFGSKKATQEFTNKVKKLDPDLIHLHNIHGYYINVEALFEYLKEANKPVVWTLHDCWAFTGHCSYFDTVNCSKWKTECDKCPLKREYPASFMIDKSRCNYWKKKEFFNNVKNLIIVTPSNWLATRVRESFLQNYPVKVINNGIDLDIFKPRNTMAKDNCRLDGKFIILGVANIWNKRKGYEYFLDLSRKLEDDEVIIMVGLTEKQKMKLPRNIIGITRTADMETLAEIYSQADVFVNPTLEDNFPTTNLEALACGTPVITFNTGGSSESIDENTGFVIEKGNEREILEKVRIVKERGKLSYLLQCRQRAVMLYDKYDRFEDYVNLYEEMLG